jgi:hypothetical protein
VFNPSDRVKDASRKGLIILLQWGPFLGKVRWVEPSDGVVSQVSDLLWLPPPKRIDMDYSPAEVLSNFLQLAALAVETLNPHLRSCPLAKKVSA